MSYGQQGESSKGVQDTAGICIDKDSSPWPVECGTYSTLAPLSSATVKALLEHTTLKHHARLTFDEVSLSLAADKVDLTPLASGVCGVSLLAVR